MIEGESEMCGDSGSESAEKGNSTHVPFGPKSVRIMVAPTDVDVTNAVVVVLLFYALTCLVCHPYFAQALVRFQTPLKGIQMKSRAGLEKAMGKVSKKRGALSVVRRVIRPIPITRTAKKVNFVPLPFLLGLA